MLQNTRLTSGFLLGSLGTGLVTGAISVYLLGDFDPKFRYAPSFAFELNIYAAFFFSFVGTSILGVVATTQHYAAPNYSPRLRKPTVTGAVSGLAYALIPWAIDTILGERISGASLIYPIVGWTYRLVFPMILFAIVVRRQSTLEV